VYLYQHHKYVMDIIHSGFIGGTALRPSPNCSLYRNDNEELNQMPISHLWLFCS
jgi:hypothetical protein